jgi:hypothetical protein
MHVARLLVVSSLWTTSAVGQAPKVRDSAGVRIVENASRLKAAVTFSLGAPTFDAGGLQANPDDEFSPRQPYFDAVRLSDGTMVISDRVRLQLFDRTGKRIRVTGRSGQGPGEFANIVGMCRVPGDTVLVADSPNGRVAVIDRTGRFVRTTPVTGRVPLLTNACFDDGTFLASDRARSSNVGMQLILQRATLSGAAPRDLTQLRQEPMDAAREGLRTLARGSAFYVGNPGASEVRRFDNTGKLQLIVRSDDRPPPFVKADMDSLPTHGVAGPGGGATMKLLPGEAMPTEWPTFGRVAVDLAGRIWIQDFRKFNAIAPDGWTAFDANGAMLGRLVIPVPANADAKRTVLSFGRDEVFVRRLDDDGALHLTIYPLVRR